MEIKTADYHISYDIGTTTINCKGKLRLTGMDEYAPIVQLFNQVVEQEPSLITFNLQQLQLLNSSGINILSKLIIKVRQKKNIKIVIQGSKKIPWQGKSLKNLQRLMPTLQLQLE